MQQSKTTELPVGTAISRLVKLEYLTRATGNRTESSQREIESLIEALNAFQVSLSFECGPGETEEDVSQRLAEAQNALDVLICDAETKCCRMSDAEVVTSSRETRASSSRGN